MNSSAEDVHRLIQGFRHTAVVYAAVRSRLFDQLESGPQTLEEIHTHLGLHAAPLASLVRSLVLLRLVAEFEGDAADPMRYGLTEAGRMLVSSGTNPLPLLSELTAKQYVPAWLNLEAALRGGVTPFNDHFGQTVWDYRQSNPEAGDLFNTWLGRQTGASTEPIVDACDLSASRCVVDVGGGQGTLLASVLARNPGVRGILAELPHTLRVAESYLGQRGLADRCDLRTTDFFETVPAGGDVYLLKSVLHDWQDEDCLRILRTIRAAMPDASRLLVIERLVPRHATDDPETVWLDLHMACVTGGRERTEVEFQGLFRAAGLVHARTRPALPFHILELTRE